MSPGYNEIVTITFTRVCLGYNFFFYLTSFWTIPQIELRLTITLSQQKQKQKKLFPLSTPMHDPSSLRLIKKLVSLSRKCVSDEKKKRATRQEKHFFLIYSFTPLSLSLSHIQKRTEDIGKNMEDFQVSSMK